MQPSDMALGILFAQWLTLAGWGVVVYGVTLALGGLVALVVVIVQWGGVTLGPPPRKLAAPPATALPRVDSGTGVVPRIPGATPHAGPVCPVCGAAWHGPVCPPPKERTEEIGVPAVDLAPQFAALTRFFEAVDETAVETEKAMSRIVDDLAGRADDCPLTTQEIPPLEPSTPFYDAAIRNTDTRELSEVMKKVSAP